MNEKVLMKGNDAIAEAAIRAGCGAYFGYPITPQNEIPAYMARHMLDRGRIFIQAESETAAVIMVYGAACAGIRAMTSSSSPGVSLKQEGLSYAAGADVPLVVANIVRGGPGLGNIAPAQSDYFQSTRGGGHGDYRCIVLAPKNVQECADLTYLAFDLADKYRMPAIIHADGMIGQMMEGCVLPQEKTVPKYDWSAGGMAKTKRDAIHITSLELDPEKLEAQTKKRFIRYETVKAEEIRYEDNNCADADMILVAYGTCARVCLGARKIAKKEGIKLGIFRPITLWPFPFDALGKTAVSGKPVLTVEMSEGQLVEDVKLSAYYAGSKSDIHLLAHSGGIIPEEEEVFAKVKEILKK
ncbi:MAG: 3-methyl-2-oxobutanoate dehydrogenase subunit VorB [Treponema sp.]|jgi:2-oxoglutarate ferredoxin oxidoreductase subunit alpha|nr:3-methyl-2-oxobutanoate dehydrogenase subunit VorB [Treponema sp.]